MRLVQNVLCAAVITALALVVGSSLAEAQQTASPPIANPLRPKPPEAKPAPKPDDKTAADKTPREQKSTAEKPARERSAKQKQNDDMMRACGAEWRAEKAALQAKGETWRNFLKDCRAKKKSEQPV